MDGEALLETHPTAQAAELDAVYLRTHGVGARVDGAMTGASSSGALTGMALGELVAIRLSVPRAQLDEARALMAELRKPDLRRPTFAGEIADSSERLAAEEEWEQKQHKDPYRTDAETNDDDGDE